LTESVFHTFEFHHCVYCNTLLCINEAYNMQLPKLHMTRSSG